MCRVCGSPAMNCSTTRSTLALPRPTQDWGSFFLVAISAPKSWPSCRRAGRSWLHGKNSPPDKPTPAVRLPAFALVLEMKKPDEFTTHLQLAFQNSLSIANLGASQNGQPQFLSGTETYRNTSISRGQLMLPKDAPRENGALQCNFSPASARSGKHFIIGSTVGIVRDVIDQLQDAATQPVSENTIIEVDIEQVAAAFAENQTLLVSRQKLEQGGTQEEAEARVKKIFDIVRQFGKARLQLLREAQSLSLETAVELRPAK